MKNALVTGIAGQDGPNPAEWPLAKGCEVPAGHCPGNGIHGVLCAFAT